uniref:Telomeric repeat-binding factor 1 n=1 Tax=Anthurium amnicola TaxID=1678845 RepID=A0A1D1YD76_9ARAE
MILPETPPATHARTLSPADHESAMAETRERKGSMIREEDVLLLLNKYPPAAILNLLKEVAQFAGVKIDWNTLVKRSATGISSAREYQMLWRHLAYQHPLLEKLEAGAEPLDDDSDLEFELEAFPAVYGETSAEAAACVKILISSGLPNETGASRPTVEVPLPTNTPNGQASCTASDKLLARSNRGPNTVVPVSFQKQPQATPPSAEGLDGNGSASASGPAKKKRKLWTKEEDMELIAAVDKCGEGNWANILKGDFKHDRTASQLSQRWSIIRKKRANLCAGSLCNATGSAPTEAHMATWQAVSMAIKMPIIGGLSARRPGSTGALQSTDAANSSAFSAAASDATTVSAPEVPNQSHQPDNQTLQKGILNPPSKSRSSTKVSTITVKPLGGPNSTIKAAAFAAGARIATPSTAASHFKAAQSKTAVYIRPGRALPGSSMSGSKSSSMAVGPQQSNSHCMKAPISSKDPVMTPLGHRTTDLLDICTSSGQLSPSSNAAPSDQPTEQVQLKSASHVHSDAHGHAESRNTDAFFDTSDGFSKEENESAEEMKVDSSMSSDEANLLNMDLDLDKKAENDQIGDSKAAAGGHLSGEPEVDCNRSESLCVDTTKKEAVAIKAGDDEPVERNPRMLNGEMAKDEVTVKVNTEKGYTAGRQVHHSDAFISADKTETVEDTLQDLTSDDDGTVRGLL